MCVCVCVLGPGDTTDIENSIAGIVLISRQVLQLQSGTNVTQPPPELRDETGLIVGLVAAAVFLVLMMVLAGVSITCCIFRKMKR